ncbi:MAG: PIG-L deacetylase family protein, partial [Rhodothermales bacterium]
MSVALFLSPHLDDVAFSCGGTLARLAQEGWMTHLATVFTRSIPNPMGFPLACQLDKGLGADVDYMALRRDEDERFAREAGAADVHHFDLPEAPHRGYMSAP